MSNMQHDTDGPDWTSTLESLPPEGKVVWARDSGGHAQKLVYDKGLWWFPDRSMYVYYVPRSWKPIQ